MEGSRYTQGPASIHANVLKIHLPFKPCTIVRAIRGTTMSRNRKNIPFQSKNALKTMENPNKSTLLFKSIGNENYENK
jgi:hypothetical protein